MDSVARAPVQAASRSFDLSQVSVRSLNDWLHNGLAGSGVEQVEVLNPDGAHSIAVGINAPLTVDIRGHAGYFCGGMNKFADLTVHGNVGWGVAENMMSGSVRVKGFASEAAGATAHGGLLVIEGDASLRCGISMKGIDIVVGGSVGHMSAFMAQAGHLVVCGDAAEALGDSIYEAKLFVRGKVESLGADCIEKDMREEHYRKLAELLDKAEINVDPKSFRRYGSARRLYNFDVDHADAY